MSFTAYDNLVDIRGANYVINDRDIIPDPGSVNPFVPGTQVMARNRNYTVYFWPDSIPVPAGLKNVILYPTKPAAPNTGAARWSLAMRQYHPQPGFTTIGGIRDTRITAVSTANPSKSVPCPLRVGRHIRGPARLVRRPSEVLGPHPEAAGTHDRQQDLFHERAGGHLPRA